LLGDELDGVMNYPLRAALIDYLRGGSAADFVADMECLRENYPLFAFYNTMNFMGNHDTPRILTVLGADDGSFKLSAYDQSRLRLSPEKRALAAARLMLGALILYCFPGSPCVFYGDEAGVEGYEDPLNRRTYPWGREDQTLLNWYKRLGQLRKNNNAMQRGCIAYHQTNDRVLCFERRIGNDSIIAAANNDFTAHELCVPCPWPSARDQMTGSRYDAHNGILTLTLEPLTAVLLAKVE
jgi:4-alpha-glucanotransferase